MHTLDLYILFTYLFIHTYMVDAPIRGATVSLPARTRERDLRVIYIIRKARKTGDRTWRISWLLSACRLAAAYNTCHVSWRDSYNSWRHRACRRTHEWTGKICTIRVRNVQLVRSEFASRDTIPTTVSHYVRIALRTVQINLLKRHRWINHEQKKKNLIIKKIKSRVIKMTSDEPSSFDILSGLIKKTLSPPDSLASVSSILRSSAVEQNRRRQKKKKKKIQQSTNQRSG